MWRCWLPERFRPSNVYNECSGPATASAISDVPPSIPPPCGATMANAVCARRTAMSYVTPDCSWRSRSAKLRYLSAIVLIETDPIGRFRRRVRREAELARPAELRWRGGLTAARDRHRDRRVAVQRTAIRPQLLKSSRAQR